MIVSAIVAAFEQCSATLLVGESLDQTGYAAGQPLAGLNGGTNWSDAWSGSAKGITIESNKLANAAINKIQLETTTADVAVFRNLKQRFGADNSTIWIGFRIKKDSGNRWFGLSCFLDEKEKLFIGAPNGSDNIRLGSGAPTATSILDSHLVIVRIDFHNGQDNAYLFLDPSPASIPDNEDANATFNGDFSFDRIRVAAGGLPDGTGVSGSIGPIKIGTEFADVIETSRNIQIASNETAANLSVLSWEKRDGALWIATSGGVLKLQPFLDRVLKVQFGSDAAIKVFKDYGVSREAQPIDFQVTGTNQAIVLRTPSFSVQVLKDTSRIIMFDANGKQLLSESPTGGRHAVNGSSLKVADRFQLTPTEAIYGLGEFRDSALNLRGKTRELVQVNTQAAMPVILSINGWGMFWDNPSRTVFRDNQDGMSFASDYGNTVSFYIFVGQRLDDLIQDYRQLTGTAPMLPRWAYGYHQSRNRYRSQQEIVSIASRIRDEHIPMDSIFLDYQYWGKYGVGSHQFDERSFANPSQMVSQLHDLHTKLIISVWPAFKAGSSNYNQLHASGLLLEGATAIGGTIYDPFNPKAAKVYWSQISQSLIPLRIDGWFLDGPEPDNVTSFLKTKTFAGPAPEVRNLYPLVHTSIFYNGLRTALPDQRVYIITRCGWASQQKNSTVVWSGDIPATFDELKKQVVAGLDFVAAGIPYWTTDIGGYSGGRPGDPAYNELYTRWWEYGTFCPIFRSHGRRELNADKSPGSNELWAYGTNVQMTCTQFSNLRYRLLPYIYSLAGDTTQKGYTPMRLLAFDFSDDVTVFNIKDEFMYGPAFLVNPVLSAGATMRDVYLPSGVKWIDFWTGQSHAGGETISADAPLDRIPIFVRAGSIVPMGPFLQYSDEKPANPIELRIYPGDNGAFELYEDDGKTFDYQNGQYTRIPFRWDESSHALTIGARQGKFPGMLTTRKFNIVWVTKHHGTGISETAADTSVKYSGKKIIIHCPIKKQYL